MRCFALGLFVLLLCGCQTLDYAKGRGTYIRDREAQQLGENVGRDL